MRRRDSRFQSRTSAAFELDSTYMNIQIVQTYLNKDGEEIAL